jgi:hypothetical protein
MQSFEQIQSYYKSLLANFNILIVDKTIDQNEEFSIIRGTPDNSELYIGMLHHLINEYPQLIDTDENKKELYDLLYTYTLSVVNDNVYSDYLHDNPESKLNIDEILNEWIFEEIDPSEYYVGNDGYDLHGIKRLHLKSLLEKLK